MNATITNENGKTFVVFEGRLDVTNVQDFAKQVAPLMQLENPDIECDCSKFIYVSSAGLRELLTLLKYVMSKSGKLVLKSLRDEVKEVFDMTNFTSLFTIED